MVTNVGKPELYSPHFTLNTERWKSDHYDAMAVYDFEDAVRFHDVMVHDFVDWVQRQFSLVRDGKISETQAHGLLILKQLETAISVTDFFAELTAEWRAAGYQPAIEKELSDSKDVLSLTRERFLKSWPLLDEADIRRGQAEIARGEFVTQTEFLGGPRN